MKKIKKNPVTLGIVIAFIVLAITFGMVTIGAAQVADYENYIAEEVWKEYNDLIFERYKAQGKGNNITIWGYINDANGAALTIVTNHYEEHPEKIVELHINYEEVDITQPLNSIIDELNVFYGKPVDSFFISSCEKEGIYYDSTSISDIKRDLLKKIVEDVAEEAGVKTI